VRSTGLSPARSAPIDKAQLQRGLKVYVEACSACHSMNLVAFRTLEDLGYSEDQVKALAANYEVEDGPNGEGEMFTRPAVLSDHFPSPFPNQEAAAYANNGAAPPDFSLLAKARYVERGFPQFVFDIFTGYNESGPNYIYSLLTGYQEPPATMWKCGRVPTTTRISSPVRRWPWRSRSLMNMSAYDDGSRKRSISMRRTLLPS
jgi:cytochrome c1